MRYEGEATLSDWPLDRATHARLLFEVRVRVTHIGQEGEKDY